MAENALEPQDTQLFKLIFQAVSEAVASVNARASELSTYRSHGFVYTNWVEVNRSWTLPAFMYAAEHSPPNYRALFDIRKGGAVDVYEMDAFQELIRYAHTIERLESYFKFPYDIDQDVLGGQLVSIVISIVDRYVHLFGHDAVLESNVLDLYLPVERFLFNEILPADVLIPIIGLDFGFTDKRDIVPGLSIEWIDDDTQRSRMALLAENSLGSRVVLGAATHALVLPGYTLLNLHYMEFQFTYGTYVRDLLAVANLFLASLRIVTGWTTGYGQVLMRPKGWVHEYRGPLASFETIVVRKYPNGYDLDPYRVLSGGLPVSQEALDETSRILQTIPSLAKRPKKSRLSPVALSRLNDCYLRESEEDMLIDATIGLEALLSDGQSSELTHKLALRMAALSSLDPSSTQSPIEVFKHMKQVYSARSKTVHGEATGLDPKLRTGEYAQPGVVHPVVDSAVSYLRMALKLMISNPNYLDPIAIDEKLLLGLLNADIQDDVT